MRVNCLKGLCAGLVASAAFVGVCQADPADAHRLVSAVTVATPASIAADEGVLSLPVDPWSPRESEAVAFANGLTVRARAVFADPNLDADGRRHAFRTLVADVFDVEALGRVLLGDNRGRLSQRQYASYQTAVTDYLVPLYASRIYNVCNSTPEVISVEEQSRGVTVRTAYSIGPNEPQTMVDWLIDPRQDGSWRVLDMAVNGVSLAQSKMEEFDAVLRNDGPDAFLERLHEGAGNKLPEPLSSAVDPPNSQLPRPAPNH